jgi:hypothetical protein
MPKRRVVVIAAMSAAIGCFPHQQTLIGFKECQAPTQRECIHDARSQTAEIVDRRAASARGGDVERTAIETTILALSNDSDEFQSQVLGRRWAPLQRFPRLTFPAVVEPTAEGGRKRWVIPMLLDLGPDGWIPGRDEEPLRSRYTRSLRDLAFWIRPFVDDVAKRDAAWRPVEESQITTLFDVRPDLGREDAGRGPSPLERPDIVAIALRVDWEDDLQDRYHRVRIFPKLKHPGLKTSPALSDVRGKIEDGAWPYVPEALRKASQAHPQEDLLPDVRKLIDVPTAGFKRFREQMSLLNDCLDETAAGKRTIDGCFTDFLYEAPDRETVYQDTWRQWVPRCLAGQPAPQPDWLYDADPAPVWLDGGTEPASFVVVGDLQSHPSLANPEHLSSPPNEELVARFFDVLRQPAEPDDPPDLASARAATFVLVAGDLGDGAASSFGNVPFVLNALGLSSPSSPYSVGTLCQKPEYPFLHQLLRKLDKPVFAVPGNHDGFAGYPGVLNQIARIACAVPLVASPIAPSSAPYASTQCEYWANNWLPILFKIKLPDQILPTFLQRPRYDGLVEWRRYFGPLDVAFNYRGHGFVGLNSYDLYASERAAVGSNAINWGGGVQTHDVKWLSQMLPLLRRNEGGTPATCSSDTDQVLFMHHDPRASVPVRDAFGTRIDRYGEYDTVDSPLSYLTLGHAGFGHSPAFDFVVPVVTPLSSIVLRYTDNWINGRENRFQEEWMLRWQGVRLWPIRKGDDVIEPYNAGPLIETINDNLGCRRTRAPSGGLSHVFFAHDDEPLDGEWLQGEKRILFPPPTGSCWEGTRFKPWCRHALSFLFKLRTDEPDEWATIGHRCPGFESTPSEWQLKPLPVPNDPRDALNARVVRLDDVGQLPTIVGGGLHHGLHVVRIQRGADGTSWIDDPMHFDLDCEHGVGKKRFGAYPRRCPVSGGEPMDQLEPSSPLPLTPPAGTE